MASKKDLQDKYSKVSADLFWRYQKKYGADYPESFKVATTLKGNELYYIETEFLERFKRWR